ncbi:bem46 protein [Conglomerata obtusa]
MHTTIHDRLHNFHKNGFLAQLKRAFPLSTFIPIAPFTLVFSLFYIFTNQTAIIYKENKFEIELNLLKSTKIERHNFDVYIIDNQSQTDLIYFHGSRIKKENHLEICKALFDATKHNIIVPFYRGYGTSVGDTKETSIMIDIHILRQIMKARDTKQILFGQSLGAAIAIYYALDANVDKIIIENPFLSMKRVVKDFKFRKYLNFLSTEFWPSCERIDKLRCPILFIISKLDKLINNKHSEVLLKLCKNGEKCVIEDANHFNAYRKDKNYFKRIADF